VTLFSCLVGVGRDISNICTLLLSDSIYANCHSKFIQTKLLYYGRRLYGSQINHKNINTNNMDDNLDDVLIWYGSSNGVYTLFCGYTLICMTVLHTSHFPNSNDFLGTDVCDWFHLHATRPDESLFITTCLSPSCYYTIIILVMMILTSFLLTSRT